MSYTKLEQYTKGGEDVIIFINAMRSIVGKQSLNHNLRETEEDLRGRKIIFHWEKLTSEARVFL